MAVVVRGAGAVPPGGENETSAGPNFECSQDDRTAASILISLGSLGIGANLALMAVILLRRPVKR